jgi:predicted nucleic acid-binding protein
MSSFLVDSNILIYAANSESPQNKTALQVLEAAGQSAGVWCLTWQNVYEFLSVVSNPKAFSGKTRTLEEARTFMDAILSAPNQRFLVEEEGHLDTLDGITKIVPGSQGPFLYDCHLATLLKDYSVKRVYTADEGFQRFSFLDVINPFKTDRWKL